MALGCYAMEVSSWAAGMLLALLEVLICPVVAVLCDWLQGALPGMPLLHDQLSDTAYTSLPG